MISIKYLVEDYISMPTANRFVKSEENNDDLYEGKNPGGGIIDNPSIHIYIAHQIMDTEDEGEQYVAPTPTNTGEVTPTDANNNENSDTNSSSNNENNGNSANT